MRDYAKDTIFHIPVTNGFTATADAIRPQLLARPGESTAHPSDDD
jgi:hypothetical protein